MRWSNRLVRTRNSDQSDEIRVNSAGIDRVLQEFASYPDRLPALRLLTPSDYDRALLPKPFRNCPTSQPCLIIGSSVLGRGFLIVRWLLIAACCLVSAVDGPAARRACRRRTVPHQHGRPAGRRSGHAGEKPEEPPTQAEIDIDVAIKKIASLNSVAAELVEEVNMLNQKFSIKGSYRKGPNNLVYLRLTVAGTCRFVRDVASGLRRRNALGLPDGARNPLLSKTQHQADPRAAQFTRDEPEDESRPSRRSVSPGRRRCSWGCDEPSSSTSRKKASSTG